MDFANKREEGRSRDNYITLLKQDIATCFGYNADLVELLLQLFSPAEAIEFIEVGEPSLPAAHTVSPGRPHRLPGRPRRLSCFLRPSLRRARALGP